MYYKKLVRQIISEMEQERTLRLYGFDWDDNILQMPTKIKLDKKVGNKWKPIEVSTEKFAEIRTDPNYRPRNNNPEDAFIDFRTPETFLIDTERAIEKNKTSPSFEKFKESLIYANPFSIITARGHNPEVIKEGVRKFIDLLFDDKDKEMMARNIISSYRHEEEFSDDFLKKLSLYSVDQLIDHFLDHRGDYYPVSSDEFGEKFGLDVKGGAASPEHNKQVALYDFISKYDDLIKSGKYKKVSLGFSDDDPRNVQAMIKFFREQLSRIYPNVTFKIKDTSEGGSKNIYISWNENEEEEYINENILIENLITRIVSKIKSK